MPATSVHGLPLFCRLLISEIGCVGAGDVTLIMLAPLGEPVNSLPMNVSAVPPWTVTGG